MLTGLDPISGVRRLRHAARAGPSDFPIDDVAHARPVYEPMRGWTRGHLGGALACGSAAAAARYVERIERDAGCPVVLVSVGSRRDETIALKDPFDA